LEQGLMEFLRTKLGTKAALRAKVNLVRYADDFVVTGSSKELLETLVQPWVVEFLRERGLSLSEEKTSVVHIEQGFDFLGWNFRKYSGKLLIKPSKKNVKTFYAKVKEIIAGSLSIPRYQLGHVNTNCQKELSSAKLRVWKLHRNNSAALSTASQGSAAMSV
jgi:RNA-directed DNA polymerase